MSRLSKLNLALVAVAALAAPAAAQDYPTRPIKIIAPFGAGGPGDVFSRQVAQSLPELLKQSVVVENRPGAASIIGADAVAKSAPDGYTLLTISNTLTANETLFPNRPYVLMRDFVPVASLNYSELVMVVHPSVPAKISRSSSRSPRRSPGALNYASAGAGTPYHMAAELFKAMTGTDIVHVPHKASGDSRNAVIGGHIEMTFDAITTMAPNVQAGPGARARHLRLDALQGAARRSDHRRSGRAGLRGDHLARHHGAGRHAEADRRQAQCGDQQDDHTPRDRRRLGTPGRNADADDARRIRRLPAQGHREMGAGGEDVRGDPAVTLSFPPPLARGRAGRQAADYTSDRVWRISDPLPTLPRKREREPEAGA